MWVVGGTTFYLLDASSGNTLATFRANTVSAPGVATNGDGVIEIFSVGADNAIYENSQTSAGSSAWSGWTSLGGYLTTTPTVGANADGSLVIFAAGSDNATLFYNAQATHNGAWSGWIPLYGIGTALSPSVASNTDGALVGPNARGGKYAGAPAIILVRWRKSTDSVVVPD